MAAAQRPATGLPRSHRRARGRSGIAQPRGSPRSASSAATIAARAAGSASGASPGSTSPSCGGSPPGSRASAHEPADRVLVAGHARRRRAGRGRRRSPSSSAATSSDRRGRRARAGRRAARGSCHSGSPSRAPVHADLPARQRLARVPLALAVLDQRAGREVGARADWRARSPARRFVGPSAAMFHSGASMSSTRHERRLAAHRQPHVAVVAARRRRPAPRASMRSHCSSQ